MDKLKFSTVINAPCEKVWDVLWGAATYPLWTAPFAEGSRVETDWQAGSKALFLDGQGRGMVSRIAENRLYELMSIQHLGEYNNGVEDTTSARALQWAGAFENYTLSPAGGQTHLVVEMDVVKEFAAYLNGKFPIALAKVKELAEIAR